MSEPIFEAMIWHLPKPHAYFPKAKQEQWLDAMRGLFVVLYPEPKPTPKDISGVPVVTLRSPLEMLP